MLAGAPRAWTEISMASHSDASCRYDVVVIGAGPAGEAAAGLGGSLGAAALVQLNGLPAAAFGVLVERATSLVDGPWDAGAAGIDAIRIMVRRSPADGSLRTGCGQSAPVMSSTTTCSVPLRMARSRRSDAITRMSIQPCECPGSRRMCWAAIRSRPGIR